MHLPPPDAHVYRVDGICITCLLPVREISYLEFHVGVQPVEGRLVERLPSEIRTHSA